MKKYLVIGATFVDINTTILVNKKFNTIYNIGGKGFNIAKGLGLFNKKVSFHTLMGDDVFGKEAEEILRKNNVSITKESFIKASTTPICSIIKDTNGSVLFEKIDSKPFSKISLPSSLGLQFSDILVFSHLNSEVFEILKVQKTLYNYKLYLSMAGSKDVSNILPYLGTFDTIFANKKETDEILNLSGYKSISHLMVEKNISQIVSTADVDGAILYILNDGKVSRAHLPNSNQFTGPIINTVGAGDSVVSSYLAFTEIFDPNTSLQKALKVASFHVRNEYSSLTILPSDI